MRVPRRLRFMELISNLALGFSVSLHPINLFFGFAGVALGVIIGILPGLGSAATIALLLPITYFLDTTTAVIMLAGIWYGSMYGGSITSILLRVPGESSSVMVAIDGHELTKQGRAGAALGMSIFSAFIAGMVGLLGLGLVAPTLAEFALDFGPPEYFALTLLGLTLVSYLATDSMWKAVAITLFGLLLGTVGLDPVRSSARFTFGTLNLQSGIDLVPMVMGLFGISEVFHLIEARATGAPPKPVHVPRGLLAVLPTREDWRDAWRAIGQGPLIGLLAKITLIPNNILVSVIVLACVAGAYGVNNNPMDIVTMTLFGVLGYLMTKYGYPHAPLVLAFVLGPIMETALRQSLIMSRGDFLVFWKTPVSGVLMTVFT